MKSLDEILCRLNNCINELDDIFDDLTYELEIDATELVKSNDAIERFYKEKLKLLNNETEGAHVKW